MASKRTRDVEEVKRKKAAQSRFKKVVRNVILNRAWLMEPEDQGISMNVKKNVALLVRQKRKPGMLTIAEKALLRTAPWQRTVEDRKKLCMILANMSCLSKLPPKIRARLVPVVKFMAISVDRVVMKQGDWPITLYYILNGEIAMKNQVYNKATKTTEYVIDTIFGPGDCIGEMALLEEIPRLHTYVAISQCELLAVFDYDYNVILAPYLQKQWNEKRKAIESIDYFKFFSHEQIVDGCKVCTMAEYKPLETIFYEDKSSVSSVHFVLSGECVILQCLNMKVFWKNGEKQFELFNNQSDMLSVLSKRSSMIQKEISKIDIHEILASSSDDSQKKTKNRAMRKMGLKEIEAACHNLGVEAVPVVIKQKKNIYRRREHSIRLRMPEEEFEGEGEDYEYATESEMLEFDESEMYGSTDSLSIPKIALKSEKSLIFEKPTKPNETLPEEESVDISERSFNKDTETASEKPPRAHIEQETHFIDVGSFTYGGIFGLGERMEDRVIMARTVVQCLLLPRHWLLEKLQNPGNVWQRRRFYLESNIPSREELFADFLKTRKWDDFRNKYVQSTLDSNSRANHTKVEDVPVMCRIVETNDEV